MTHTHISSLKSIAESDDLAPQFWEFSFWESLKDLGFEEDGISGMSFNQKHLKYQLSIDINKQKDGHWFVKVGSETQPSLNKTLKFKTEEGVLNYIHSTFQKF